MFGNEICENNGRGAPISVIGHVSDAIRLLLLCATDEKKKKTALLAGDFSPPVSSSSSQEMLLRVYLHARSSGQSAASSVPVPAFKLGTEDVRDIIRECKSITSAIADEGTMNEGIINDINTILALRAWLHVKRDVVAHFVRESASASNLGNEDMMQLELLLIDDISFTRRTVIHALPCLEEQADTRFQGRAIVHAERLWSDAYTHEMERVRSVGGEEQYEWYLWAKLRALIKKGKAICDRWKWKRYARYANCPEEDEVWWNLAQTCSERLQITMHLLKFVRRSETISNSSVTTCNAHDLHALAQKLIDDGPAVTREDFISHRQTKMDQMYRCALDVVKHLTPDSHIKEWEKKSSLSLMGIGVMDVGFL